MVNSNDLSDFSIDITRATAKSVAQSFNSVNRNTTLASIAGGISCALCVNMAKNNAIPLLTLTVCTGCGIFMFNPAYKSVKAVIEAPFKGLID